MRKFCGIDGVLDGEICREEHHQKPQILERNIQVWSQVNRFPALEELFTKRAGLTCVGMPS